jgi:FkbM family methyltransferase
MIIANQVRRVRDKIVLLFNSSIISIHRLTGISRSVRLSGRIVSIPFVRNIYCVPAEPWMSTLLIHILKKKKGVFIDIGVNLGQTLAKVKAIEPDRPYIGFEPNPNCFLYLHYFIADNNWKNLRIFPFALGSLPDIVNIIFNSSNPIDPSASVIEGLRDPAKISAQCPITIMPIELALKQFDPVSNYAIIKIDTEGSELEVLQSIEYILSNHNPILLIEFLPIYNQANLFRLQRTRLAEELLRRHQYTLFNVRKNQYDHLLQLLHINEIPITSSLSECDYLALHKIDLDLFNDFEITPS